MYAVLFDIDGTLIRTGGAGQLAFAQAFREEFGVEKLSGDVPFAGRSDRAIALDLMRLHAVPPTPDHWERFRACYLRHLPAALALRPGAVLPGVVEFIDALEAQGGVAQGLLTGNVSAGARAKLTHYRLAERFAFGGFGDVATDRAQIAAEALSAARRHVGRLTGVDGDGDLRGVMVIGDTEHDIRCARAIDAVAVGVPTGATPSAALAAEQPDILLDDLSDFRTLLEIVAAA
jgi:phosphoglycolate phosphatase-like HAD superfamily hydrolase